jgi:diguanylate cyclase (GGDEF)-like protein
VSVEQEADVLTLTTHMSADHPEGIALADRWSGPSLGDDASSRRLVNLHRAHSVVHEQSCTCGKGGLPHWPRSVCECSFHPWLPMDQQHDAMTGLLDRRSMWTAAPWLTPLTPGAALIELDVISLHAINSGFGHAYGDRVLVETAHRLQRVAGASPVWRFCGDDFVIAMRVAGADELRRFTHDLRIAIEEPIERLTVGVWMGAAIASPTTKLADNLLRLADMALSHAHRQGTRELVIAPDDTLDSD